MIERDVFEAQDVASGAGSLCSNRKFLMRLDLNI